MARQIDKQKIKDHKLSKAEVEYLRVRGRLPKDYPLPSSSTKSSSTPTIADRGGIVDDDEENDPESNYEEGWNNDQRKAELSSRGLSIEGRKDDLISRLRRSDTGQLKTSDYDEQPEDEEESEEESEAELTDEDED